MTKKVRIDKTMSQLKFSSDENGNYKKHKVRAICNSAIYVKVLESNYFLGLYYLIS